MIKSLIFTIVGEKNVSYTDKKTGERKSAIVLQMTHEMDSDSGEGLEVSDQFLTLDQHQKFFDGQSAIGQAIFLVRGKSGFIESVIPASQLGIAE